jgi:N-acetylneuraminic acid mutarotase
MIVWGGVNPATPAYYLGSGARYNPVSNSWVPLPLGPTERTDHSAVWTGSEMLVWGGRNEFNPRLTAGARYKPATNSWQAISAAGAPAGRWDHTAVWTGTRMIVWGGISQVYELTGGRYDPSTDTWLPTSIDVNLPVSRTRHTAVWTGTEMIVWGGMNGGVDPLDSGGRYDPATDSWITLPVGLKGSLDHTAVWTESEMIVWGGHDFFGSLNTGARYKPSTNSWIPTSVEAFGEPASRRGHTAVWTGTEMIVWGGFDGDDSSLLESGGRYRPATNVWLPVASGNGAPAARGRHTAVWTGTEMIVWGGLVASGPGVTAATNSGGQYNPSTDSWQNTPRGAHVAGPRAGHVAAWTGTEMLVWGGNDNGDLGDGSRLNPATGSWSVIPTQARRQRVRMRRVYGPAPSCSSGAVRMLPAVLDSGGRYAPAGNSWQPIAQAGAPSARSGHSSVWTGARMIVLGRGRARGDFDPAFEHGRPIRPGRRFMGDDVGDGRGPNAAQRAHSCLDRKRDDRLGRRS